MGFGRKYAVISCAFDSSMPSRPARRVGFAATNLVLTCCQVRGSAAKPDPARQKRKRGANRAAGRPNLIFTDISLFNGTLLIRTMHPPSA